MKDLKGFYKLFVKANRDWLAELDIKNPPTEREIFLRDIRDSMAIDYYLLTGIQISLSLDYEEYEYVVREGDNAQNSRVVYRESV